jgi:hypothetical protein
MQQAAKPGVVHRGLATRSLGEECSTGVSQRRTWFRISTDHSTALRATTYRGEGRGTVSALVSNRRVTRLKEDDS